MEKFWQNIISWWEGTAPKIWSGIGSWWASAAPAIINAVVILILGFWLVRVLTKIIKRALKKGNTDVGVQQFTVSLINTLLKALVIITAAAGLGMNVASIVTALGAAGVTAGLALKDSLSNFVSGVTLLYTRPFKVGDFIEFDGKTGTVLEIQLMVTILKTDDNKHVVIPNSHLTSNLLVNNTAEEIRRASFSWVASHPDDAKTSMEVFSHVLEGCDKTRSEPEPKLFITSLDDKGVHITAHAWCKTEDFAAFQHEVWKNLQVGLQEKNIRLPHNQLDVEILEKS